MSIIAYIFEVVLLIWFFGCIVTYRLGNVLLVEGMGIKSVEFGMLVVYAASILLRVALPQVGNWFVLAVLVFWLVIQYFCHWHFTIFGATPEKIQGYNQCMKRTHGPAKSYLKKHEIQGQEICEAISVCQWKLELMAKRIFDQIWGDQGKAVAKACQMLESCMYAAGMPFGATIEGLQRQMDKLEKRMLSLGQMRADGELTREQYQNLYAQAAAEREKIQGQLEHASAEGGRAPKLDLTQIKKKLAQVVDVSTPKISDELVEEFVEVVTPVEDYHYRWKLNFGEIQERGRYDLLHPESPPVLSFTIDFEMARQYRKENELPPQFRRSSWNDLFVEVYL